MTPTEQPQMTHEPTVAVAKSSIGLKELLVPISIIIAGLFVGIGLYMSGGSASPQLAVAPTAGAPVEAADTTDKVNPVTNEDWIKGNPDAPVVIVEYSDFDCPFCSRFHTTMDEVVVESDGQVAWVYRHFPLEQLHPQAGAVALAAECVGAEAGTDAFWQFTDSYFAARGAGDATPHSELIPRLVTAAGVAEVPFTNCFEGGAPGSKIQTQSANAIETGGRGTPWSIVIGPDGKTYPINGAQTKQAVQQIINVALGL